ncbi:MULTISPECIES: transcriptional regulator SlyA [Shewanella]|uniref:transcriptional regulator SlyA n=1 Tax=Shewanella TaxID=22 RepID=UPI000C40E14C|nr:MULTISPECIES: transcriptional regulator SlyA [Shewanella]NCQ45456.1 transcriptional regulator SlyA [Shewanella frigidimarina]MBB1320848.1 transcriptional regulator SlyA [Shewanella sp. SR43-8]MBB1387951.1 transcriptional regulator SlyA [Shewanella sp. SG44-6]NCO71515.1 transcriptional regulator SlyA [Shewanella vesiculosa]NCP36673.1 transcriptional regulator SlyA [Shewanella vesiculosa]
MSTELERLKELHLAEQLGRLHRLWRTVADVELIPLGLTHPRWTALWKLLRLGDNVSQKVLADALEIELPSLMRTLGQLEEHGYVKRRCCDTDKRARIVSLTPQGTDILKQIETRIMQIRAELLNGISHQELNEFERVISLISANAMAKLNQSDDPFSEK